MKVSKSKLKKAFRTVGVSQSNLACNFAIATQAKHSIATQAKRTIATRHAIATE